MKKKLTTSEVYGAGYDKAMGQVEGFVEDFKEDLKKMEQFHNYDFDFEMVDVVDVFKTINEKKKKWFPGVSK